MGDLVSMPYGELTLSLDLVHLSEVFYHMMIALIVVGVLVLGLAGFVFWFLKIRDPLKGEDF